jgi:hypothetical protein
LPHSKQLGFDRDVISPQDGHILCDPYPAITGCLCILCSSRIANSTISRPKEKLVAFISVTLLLLGDFHIQSVDTFQPPTVFGLIASRFQIGLGLLAATSTANISRSVANASGNRYERF